MNNKEIEFIKKLDPYEGDGTVQSMFLNNKASDVPYVKALEFLVKAFKAEKDALKEDNKKLSKDYGELTSFTRTISTFGGTVKDAQALAKKALDNLAWEK